MTHYSNICTSFQCSHHPDNHNTGDIPNNILGCASYNIRHIYHEANSIADWIVLFVT